MLLVVCLLNVDFYESVAYFIFRRHLLGSVLWKSSPKSPPAASFICFDTMAIGATDLTFSDFFFNGRPRDSIIQLPSYISRLVAAYMVKLKNAHISFTAINTGMFG